MVSTLLLFVNRLPEEAREEECDKDMRKLVYLLGLLFFMACGEDAKVFKNNAGCIFESQIDDATLPDASLPSGETDCF